MKKFIFCVSLVLTGLMTSCVDKYQEVDADSKPEWLGESIYAELKNANQQRLSGTFTNYLRLIDDLGYAETLSRTGSKSVFPANDSAFARFFAKNDWGVSRYEDLTDSQKKLLLYSSMLDNALLLGLLPNAYNGTNEPDKGAALRHATNVSVIDTVQYIASGADMPQGNPYWTKYFDKGIHLVSDNTRPMMVHLTREYMLNNDITTVAGEGESDFSILTGTPYTEGTAYIFNNRVVKGDITCQNGYIHQMEDVLVPPGNMAQVLRRHDKTKYFSRILDHYAAPYYDENTTRNYNDWAKANGKELIDSIYQIRYLSARSQGGNALVRDPNGNDKSTKYVLGFDPGWNQYYPGSDVIKDMGAFFVPDDEAVKTYFLPGGGGSHLINIYGSAREGSVTNDEAHLMENLDSLHATKPEILASFCRNLMKTNFTQTVPSKFPNVTNDASENMGITMGLIDKKDDGKYDITIANNGVIYIINEMIVPDEYRSVMAPASEYPDMRVMNWAIQDGHNNGDYLGLDFSYYLLAMSANYAFFIPEDKAFDYYYLDPASLGHTLEGKPHPDVLHFYFDTQATKQPYVKCMRYGYNIETGELDATGTEAAISQVKSQLIDVLNYHTVVLKEGEEIGQNHYYKTKHGGAIYVDGSNKAGTHVMGGLQKDLRFFNYNASQDKGEFISVKSSDFEAPTIKEVYKEKNGHAYRLDRTIQPPTESVFAVLKGTVVGSEAIFSEFLNACDGFDPDLLTWAGISPDEKVDANGKKLGYSDQDAYIIFTRNYKLGSTSIADACPDKNVKMFNTYNYTLFAPDNKAMKIAYDKGLLPRWSDVQELYDLYNPEDGGEPLGDDEEGAKEQAKKMIAQIRDFVRYHFVTGSVYVDNTIESGRYQALISDPTTGVAKEVRISGGNNVLTVTDLKNHSISINAGSGVVNKMTRDYWLNGAKARATGIETSSFCAVHQISEPLYNK